MSEPRLQVDMRIQEVALIPADDMPMDEAVTRVRAIGHRVVRVDGRRIIVEHVKED